jgi:hypothetical protein
MRFLWNMRFLWKKMDNDEPPRLFTTRTTAAPGFCRPLSIRERKRERGYPWQRRLTRLRRMQRRRRLTGAVLWSGTYTVYRVLDRPTGPLGTDGNEYEPTSPDEGNPPCP